jgi:tripartite-type tricarboxylate transporter receptor subunit TctC
VVGATSANSDEGLFSTLLNNMFHTKLKLITGYKSAGEVRLAVERGELQGNLNTYSSLMNGQPTWITEKKVRIPIQLTLTPFAPLGNVPMALDILKSEEDKRVLEVILAKSKLARPFVMADGVPADRVAIIRKAFNDVTKDPEFVAEANKTGINVNPVLADEVQKTVARVYATPEALLQRVRQMVGGK